MEYLFLTLALVLNAIANIMMKVGAANLHYFKEVSLFEALTKNYLVGVGILLFAFNIIFYAIAISKINLSLAYPLMVGGGFIIITLASVLFLHEHVSALHIVGMTLILLGIVIVTIGIK